MASLWAIIRSADTEPDPENELESTICGIYSSKGEAIEEILKLYVEDDINLVFTPDTPEGGGDQDNTDPKGEDVTPTIDEIKEQRRRLIEDDISNTYTNYGNNYSLINCVLGAKHEFDKDVVELYKKSLY